MAEISKKWNGGKVPANGSRTINAFMNNGRLVGQNTQAKWAKQPVWYVAFYNFHEDKWVPEKTGRLTYRQAYGRASYLKTQKPYNKVGIVLVPSAVRALKKKDLSPVAETTTE